ncbi:MAG: hypothetical protein RIF34_05475, partial [Candidatus Kapaibacterium sp.]
EVMKSKHRLTPKDIVILQDAGNELAGLALDRPGSYLNTLNLIRDVLTKNQIDEESRQNLSKIQVVLQSQVLQNKNTPVSELRPDDSMNKHFLKTLINSDFE